MGVKKQHRLVLLLVCLILIGVTVYPHIPALVKVAQAVQGELKFGSTFDQVMTVINKTYYSADVFFGNASGGRVGVLKGTGNVGIGNITPNHRLSVEDTMAITAATGAQYLLMGNQDTAGQGNPAIIRATNGNLEIGKGTAWVGPGGTFTSNVFFGNTGNVGIGSTAPTKKLDVVGDINFSGTLYQGGVAFQGSKWTNTTGGIYYNSGNVGVGTTAPRATLDVGGNTSSFGLNTWSQSTGKYHFTIGGGNDQNWKRVARFQTGSGIYQSIAVKGTLVDFNNNYGGSSQHIEVPFAARFQGYTGAGWDESSIETGLSLYQYLRVIRLGVRDFELQVRQPRDWTVIEVEWYVTQNYGNASTVTVYNGDQNGATPASDIWNPGTATKHSFGELLVGGNVGIGTTNPQKKLDIAAASSTVSNTSGNLSIVPNANLLITQGNVGIGTTAPGSKLDVDGNVTQLISHGNNMKLWLSAARNGAANGEIALYSWISEPGVTWTGGGIARNMVNLNGFPRVNTGLSGQMIRFDEGATPSIIFTTETSGGTRYTPMNINGNNVGIGSTAPAAKLDVGGTTSTIANVTGNLSIVPASNLLITQGNVGIGQPSPGYKLHVEGNAYINGNYLMVASEGRPALRVGAAWGISGIYNGADSVTIGTEPAYNIYMTVGGSHKLTVQGSSGNVGIGTTAPLGKLHVVGGINNSLVVDRTGAPAGKRIQLFVGDGTVQGGMTFVTDEPYFWGNNVDFHLGGWNPTAGVDKEYFTVIRTGATAGNVGIGTTAPAAKLEVNGKIKESGVKSWYVGFTNGPAFASGAWNNVGPSLAFTSDGGPLEISWDISVNGGSHVTCQVVVDGVWPGTAAGYPETGSPYWHEGLTYLGGGGWQPIGKSKVYRGIAAGNHTAQAQCATDGGTVGVCNAGSVACSISVVQLPGT